MILRLPPRNVLQHAAENLEYMIEREVGFSDTARLVAIAMSEQTVFVLEVPIEFSNDPIDDMYILAQSTAERKSAEYMANLIKDHVAIGWIFVHEFATDMTQAPIDQLLHHGEDTPNIRRTRFVFGMDLLGRLYNVVRQEGDDAQRVTQSHAPTIGGKLPKALRAFNIAVAEQLPDKDRFLAALSTVEILNDEEISAFALNAKDSVRGIYYRPDRIH